MRATGRQSRSADHAGRGASSDAPDLFRISLGSRFLSLGFSRALDRLANSHNLHMVVGLNDTYLANKLPRDAAAAGAAVGTITYLLWFFNLLVAAVGTGSTAIIARAKGARHRRQANSVTGQSMSAAILLGLIVG